MNPTSEAEGHAGESTVDVRVLYFERCPNDGEDPFPGAGQVAMACRLYGQDHAPTVEQIVEVLGR